MNMSEGTKKYIFLNPIGEKILFNTENCHLANSNSWGSPRTTWDSPKQGLPLYWERTFSFPDL